MKKEKTASKRWQHSEKFFMRWENRLKEPFKNTRFYNLVPLFALLAILLPTVATCITVFVFAARKIIISLPTLIIAIIICVVTFLILIKPIKNGAAYAINVERFNNQDDYIKGGHAALFSGPPGTGKTFSVVNIGALLAALNWQTLQRDYYLQSTMLGKWLAAGEVEKLKAFQLLKESYEFMKANENKYIPCLASTIPLWDNEGRMSYELDGAYYALLKRLPEYIINVNDDCGNSQGCNISSEASDNLIEYWRFHRQFYNSVDLNTEQGDDGLGKFIRKSTDYTLHLLGQEWVLKPKLALKFIDWRIKKYIAALNAGKLTGERALYIGQKLFYINSILRLTVGFRKISYKIIDSTGGNAGEGYYIFPSRGIINYNDRAYCFQNPALIRDIDLNGWREFMLDEYDMRKYNSVLRRGDKND